MQQSQSPVENIQKQYSIKGISSSPTKTTSATTSVNEKFSKTDDYDPNECTGCNEQVREGQALIALGRPWHSWCFK